MNEKGEIESTPRRRLLSRLFWGAIAGVSAGLALPALAYMIGPLLRSRDHRNWIKLGGIDELPLQTPKRLEVGLRQNAGWVTEDRQVTAWVVRLPDRLYVFDPHCTHLGCAYHWHEQNKQFFCPCHAGVFDIEGRVISGPPPRPLDVFKYEIREGALYVVPAPIKRVV